MQEKLTGFRETTTTSAEACGRYVRQSSGPGIYGIVWLRVEPLERGKGFEFVNALTRGVIPDEFIRPVEEGVREAMASGGPAGFLALKAAVEKAHPILLKRDDH